jgi:hypothetical protein
MKSAQGKRSQLAKLVVLAAIVLVAVAVLAAPALAAPNPTEFSQAYANSTLLKYGGGTMISAVLMDTSEQMALGGLFVDVEQSTEGPASGWVPLYIVTTRAEAYDSGTYSGPVVPLQNTWYRFVFEGTPAYAAVTSEVLAVQVKPILSKPTCPAKIKHGKKFTVKGTIKPWFSKGAKTVTIRAYRMNKKHKWVIQKTKYLATNGQFTGYTPYSVRIKLSKAGKYRFNARTTTSTQWVAVKTGYSRTLTVK